MRVPEHRDLSDDERRRAVESLRTVGGLYDFVAAFVEHDRSRPERVESGHA